MKQGLRLLILGVLLLGQSCNLSERCSRVDAENQRMAEELKQGRQRIAQLEEQLLDSDRELAGLQDDNRRLYAEKEILANELRIKNDAGSAAKWQYEPVPEIRGNPGTDGNASVIRRDTVNRIKLEVSKGNVAFYCPPKVTYKESFTALGFLADGLPDEAVRALLIRHAKQVERDSSDVDTSGSGMVLEPVLHYKQVELRLEPASNSSFEIVKVNLADRQTVSPGMEGWQWKITPLTTTEHQQLVLKIIIYDENGAVDLVLNKTRFIDVAVSTSSFFRNTKVLFTGNPEWAFGSVILPFITFLFGYYQKRKKQKADTNTAVQQAEG